MSECKRCKGVHDPTKHKSGPSGPSGKHKTPRSTTRVRGKAHPRIPQSITSQFIAWDGEGGTLENSDRHHYILLMSSDNDILISPRKRGLTTSECLALLCGAAKREPNAINVAFGMSYDANMMLCDVPEDKLADLHAGQIIDYEGYRIQYRARKCLDIWQTGIPRYYKTKAGRYVSNHVAHMRLWDVWGFFQSSFVHALIQWIGDTSEHGDAIDTIIAGKAKRSTFAYSELHTEIIPYTTLEVRLLVELMNQLRERLLKVDLLPVRWDGAGAVAAKLLQRENIRDHRPDDGERLDISRNAYAGGRMELLQYGHHKDKVYHYDINSAYPYAISQLPSMADGYWRKTEYKRQTNLTIAHVDWTSDGTKPCYPLFYREPGNMITFPGSGSGWYWGPELELVTGYAEWLGLTYTIDTCLEWSNQIDKPFAFVPELYAKRRELKRANDHAHYVIKLGLNSLYGKMAQSVGYDETTGRKPPFHCLEWAGWVTSYTRAQLYDAMMLDPEAIIMVATDGIFSTRPLELPIGVELGQWEQHVHDELVVAQSGVYFYRDGDTWHEHYRGFDPGAITRQGLLAAYRDGMDTLYCPVTRFVALGTALRGGMDDWRQWITSDRKLSLTPDQTKRMSVSKGSRRADLRLVRTLPTFNPYDGDSAPYPLPWEIDRAGQEMEAEIVDTLEL